VIENVRARFMRQSYVAALSIALSQVVTGNAFAALLDGALDAIVTGEQYLNVSVVPLYQNALRSGADTGNYTADAIGKFTVRAAGPDSSLGNTDLVFWLNSSSTLGNLQSASQMAAEAGLLWDTNDIGADSSNTSFLVLGIDQWFLDERVSVGFGKMFPGQMVLSSPYTADNSNTFTSKMISGNPVVSWWEALGIGANVGYFGKHWFLQASFIDSKAESDLDFSSFFDGKFTYLVEATWQPENPNGETSIGLVGYYTEAREQRTSESGVVGQFTYEWGADANYAAFGRYSYRDGGESENLVNPVSEEPVKHGGFIGFGWNRPFGRADDLLAAAWMYGEPTDNKQGQGFGSQHGAEIFWSLRATAWLKLLPNVQVIRNRWNDLETVVGIRINVGFQRNWRVRSVYDL